MKHLLLSLSLCLLVSGCVQPHPGVDKLTLRAQQVQSVALATLNTALKFEATHRDQLPKGVQKAAAAVRSKAGKALVTADDTRRAYVRGAATGDKLLLSLELVEETVKQVRWWTNQSAASGGQRSVVAAPSPTDQILQEAAAYNSDFPQSWITAVPIFIDLAKQVYTLVNNLRNDLSTQRAWTAEEADQFRAHLLQTISQPHWRQ